MLTPVTIIAIPTISAFIGWITNLVAIEMLFRPEKPVRFLGLTIQGVFPKRQRDVAEKIGEIVSRELISSHEIMAIIGRHITPEHIQATVAAKVDVIISERLPSIFPAIGMLLVPRLVDGIKELLVREATDAIVAESARLAGQIESELNLQQIVQEKVASFSTSKLEALLKEVMKKEFRFIEVIGAVLGFLIGLGQLGIMSVGAMG